MLDNGKPTSLLAGDVIFADVTNRLLSIQRPHVSGSKDGRLCWSYGDNKKMQYCLHETDWANLAIIIADVANLHIVVTEKIDNGYRFVLG